MGYLAGSDVGLLVSPAAAIVVQALVSLHFWCQADIRLSGLLESSTNRLENRSALQFACKINSKQSVSERNKHQIFDRTMILATIQCDLDLNLDCSYPGTAHC